MRIFSLKYNITHTKICIIGGGSAGLNISAHFSKQYDPKQIRIFEPSQIHYYQPGFTMVGGNLVDGKVTYTENWRLYNKSIHWTQQKVKRIQAEKNLITTQNGDQFTYDQLIIASGVKLDWHKIKGAKQAIDDPNSPVVSIYTYDSAEKTRRFGQNFKGGKAIFTEPEAPIKCGGAPQKILYLLTKEWQDKGIKFQSHFYKVGDTMFPVPKYSIALDKYVKGYGILPHFKNKLIEVKKDSQQAVFEDIATKNTFSQNFDFLHLVPPMSPHQYIKESGLANETGYVNVDKHTLQHVNYPNIWSLGDCSGLPCSKTAAAIFSQTEVLVKNFNSAVKNQPLKQKYNGYSCCPIFIGGNKLMLAEFLYEHKPTELAEMMHLEVPKIKYYWLKKHFFPYAYWKIVPTGFWGGRKGIAIDY